MVAEMKMMMMMTVALTTKIVTSLAHIYKGLNELEILPFQTPFRQVISFIMKDSRHTKTICWVRTLAYPCEKEELGPTENICY